MTMINSYSTRQLRDEEFDEESDFYFDYKHHTWWEFELGIKLDITERKELMAPVDDPNRQQARDRRYDRGHFEVNIHLRPNRYIVGDLIYDDSENLYIPFKYIDYPPYHQPDMIFYSDEEETTLRVLPLFQVAFSSVVEARKTPGFLEYQTIFQTDDNARREAFVITKDKFPTIFETVQTFDISTLKPPFDNDPVAIKTFEGLKKRLESAADFWDMADKFPANRKPRGAA